MIREEPRKRSVYLTRVLLLSFLILNSINVKAATLKGETLAAWDSYVLEITSGTPEKISIVERIQSTTGADRPMERVKAGEMLVVSVGQTPHKIPGGLIHHWMGTAFIPGASIDPVLSVIRDYAHYRNYYHPAVIDSRLLATEGQTDHFRMTLTSKSVGSKTALSGEYQSSIRKVDDHRWYSISRSTRIQEVQNYGTPQERALKDDQGTGLIWRLLSINRFEERDGGVYVQMEAVALSRDIPASLRWLVTPIVRRVSKDSLATSLQQTSEAVAAHNIATAQAPVVNKASSHSVLPAVSAFTLLQ